MRQVFRTVLAGESLSADEHIARPLKDGGYGELMDEIDRLIEESTAALPTSSAAPEGTAAE